MAEHVFYTLKTANSPYINRFVQPDTIIPDLSNPQGWDRYSYVTNRPVNFSDPTGHKMTTDTPEEGGKCDMECLLDLHHKDNKKEDKSCKDSACKRHNEDNDLVPISGIDEYLDGIFDPWSGTFYPGSPTDEVDMLWFAVDDLYNYYQIDFDAYARNGESNPLTFDQINNSVAQIGIGPLLTRAGHVPYQIFLAQVGVPHDVQNHVTNYEPQYLSALMKYHPRELEFAKQEYYRLYPNEYYELIQDWGPGVQGPDTE